MTVTIAGQTSMANPFVYKLKVAALLPCDCRYVGASLDKITMMHTDAEQRIVIPPVKMISPFTKTDVTDLASLQATTLSSG